MFIQNLLLVIFLCRESAWVPETDHQLEVTVQNVRPGKGLVRVCLFDREEDFLSNAIQCHDVPASQTDSVQVIFSHLKANTFAIAAYQDYNENGILDRNWIGLPAEPYGFSNNPSTFFGPPSFSIASFELKVSSTIIIQL